MVDTSELQIRTMEQLLKDFDGEVESALKMKNLIYTLFQRPTAPEDGEAVPVADQGGTQVDGIWSSDNGGPTLPEDSAIATDGDTIPVDGATVTLDVAGGSITGGSLPATSTVVSNGDTVTVDGATVTLAVSGNDLTGGSLPATSHIVEDGDTGTVRDQAGNTTPITFSVAGGDFSQIEFINSTAAIVTDGETPAVQGSGTTATLQVIDGVVTVVLS